MNPDIEAWEGKYSTGTMPSRPSDHWGQGHRWDACTSFAITDCLQTITIPEGSSIVSSDRSRRAGLGANLACTDYLTIRQCWRNTTRLKSSYKHKQDALPTSILHLKMGEPSRSCYAEILFSCLVCMLVLVLP